MCGVVGRLAASSYTHTDVQVTVEPLARYPYSEFLVLTEQKHAESFPDENKEEGEGPFS